MRKSLAAISAAGLMIAAALLYGSLASNASPEAGAALSEAEIAALRDARTGDLKKLKIHDAPRPALEHGFETARGTERHVGDWDGKVKLLNFWATWCPPCVEEMPALDRLAGAMAGEDFAVIALAMERSGVDKIETFYRSIDAENLEIYREPTMRIGTEAGVLGMPITLILDRQGREVARMQGAAEWDSEAAQAFLRQFIQALSSAEG